MRSGWQSPGHIVVVGAPWAGNPLPSSSPLSSSFMLSFPSSILSAQAVRTQKWEREICKRGRKTDMMPFTVLPTEAPWPVPIFIKLSWNQFGFPKLRYLRRSYNYIHELCFHLSSFLSVCFSICFLIPHSSSLICILLCLPHTQSNDKTGTPSKSLGAAAISIGDLSRVPGVYSSLDSCWKFGLAIRISLFWIPYTCCSREKQLQNGLLSFSDLCPYVS